jgi:phage tail sheath protein FI
MPVTPTFPGVYIEEIPSGVRTIVGVATSVAAFVGRAARGPVNTATVINGFGDFERIFGGLWLPSALGFAVRDFFLNGGSQAVIVRLYRAEVDAQGNPVKDVAKLKVDDLSLEAASLGKWGSNLRVGIDVDVLESVATSTGLQKKDLFNLTIADAGPGGTSERFLNVSTAAGALRRVDKVLKGESQLMRWSGDYPATAPPMAKTIAAHDKGKALAGEQKKLADMIKANPNDPGIPAQKTAVEAAQTALAAALFELKDPVSQAEQKLADALKQSPQKPDDIQKAKDDLAAAKKAFADTVSLGEPLQKDTFTPANGETEKKGIYALEQLFASDGIFNILCIPPYTATGDVDVSLVSDAAAYCEKRRAMLLVDPPSAWRDKSTARTQFTDPNDDKVGTRSRNAALFFPRLRQPNPLRNGQVEEFVPCGVVAGVFARTDTQRGVWKAPAGLEAALVGVPQLSVALTNEENGELNPLGINCLRAFPAAGRVVWGSRTLRGADQLADEYKYIPIRRLALFIEETLFRGTQWVVFEPNDEPLWAQIRLNVGAFMNGLFRQGAFQGQTPKDAYFVKCDRETNPQADVNKGIVNIVVGFAPLKPAEFVIIKIQQMAGQIET